MMQYLVGPYYNGPKLTPAPSTPSFIWCYFSNINGETLIGKYIRPVLLTPYYEK